MPEEYHSPQQAFLDYIKFEKRFSQHTITAYKNDLEQFFSYLNDQYGPTALHEISPPFVKSWLASLKEEKISSKTINRKISSLKSFFKFHLRSGLISTTPMWSVTSPKISKRLPQFVKETKIRDLFQFFQFPDDWQGKTDKLVINLFYQTGMRLSELVNLKESHIDKDRNSVKLIGKGNKERIIPLNPALTKEVIEYMAAKRTSLEKFDNKHLLVNKDGKKLYAKYVYLHVKKYMVEVTTLDKKSPHILRHSFATHMMNHGADLNAVKELLGHSSLAATQVYTHNTIEKLKNIHKKAHPKA